MGGASWSSRSGLAVGLAAVAGLAAACSSNDGSGAGSDTSTGGQADPMAYLSCLSEHG